MVLLLGSFKGKRVRSSGIVVPCRLAGQTRFGHASSMDSSGVMIYLFKHRFASVQGRKVSGLIRAQAQSVPPSDLPLHSRRSSDAVKRRFWVDNRGSIPTAEIQPALKSPHCRHSSLIHFL
jgi:hypothetical protein